MIKTNLLKISLLMATVSCGLFLSAGKADALYSGKNESDNLVPCTGECKQYQCGTGENFDFLGGCAAYGYVCCVVPKPKEPGQVPHNCMGFCIEDTKCEQLNGTGDDTCNNDLGDANTTYVCCGTEKKGTSSPTGLACCSPKDQCKTKINPAIVCPKAGDACCIPAGAGVDATQSTLGQECNGFPCPLGTDIPALMGNIVRYILGFVGALFLGMFIWGGALYITAGDSKRAEEGQKTLVNAVIGVAIVGLSYTLLGWVLEKISSLAQ